MNWFRWTAAALLTAVSASASGNRPAADPAAVAVTYIAPFHRIALTEDLRLTEIKEEAEYDSPVSAAPSRTVTTERSASVSPEQAAELLRFIRESGFYELKSEYGAGPKERSYPSTILVREGTLIKQVVCRSSPEAEKCPEAFAQTEKKIIEFTQQAVQTETRGE